MSAPLSIQPGPSQVAPRAGLALALLLGINLFNYIDRFVLSAVVPMLKLDASLFSPSDPLLHSKIGMLSTAFMFAYMLTSPVFAWLGDRGRRWPLIGLGVILWSLASGGTGLAIGFGMLLATRCLVGIGEAAYGPVAPSMLCDLYPQSRRGQIMSFFYMAIPVGSALGVVLGGQVARHLGWRWAFYVVVLPGLLLGGLCFLMREPPRIADANSAKVGFRTAFLHLIRIRSLVYCTLGMTCMRSPFSHQSCQSMPQRLCSRTPAVTLGLIFPFTCSSNSVQAPLWPPMLSTQNGLDIDRQPWVLSFWYMYFV